jgi:GR25 family glycosyltransferase involved in LPS biosynthesis
MNSIKHIFYINLDSRPDRKEHVEKQLQILGLQGERFPAIRLSNGRIGCSMSHLKCLEIAKERDWEHVLILEDDIEFLHPKLFETQLNKFFNNQPEFDVLLFAGNNYPPYQKIEDYCVKVFHCQTTTGYLVKKHYYDTLIANIRQGIHLLIQNPEKHSLYAIDKWWFQLQEKNDWYLITPLSVTQKEDYSDIEKRQTNYTRFMIDLDKPWLKKT